MANCIIRDDCIKRADVEKVLREEYANRPLDSDRRVIKSVFDKINRINSRDVRKNVRGRWDVWIEEIEDRHIKYKVIQCERCGYRADAEYRFCPNCGAIMDGGEQE